jgi:large subunit ribosomal protein L6
MSRIGKLPIEIPSGVTITVESSNVVVKGPKGELSTPLLNGMTIKQEENQLTVSRASEEAIHRARHGLMRTLIHNMVVGVTTGFTKELEVNGVGYRVNMAGADLNMKLGFSHDIKYPVPQGIQVSVDQNKITVAGIDKQQVGQVAAEIRSFKKPEPYKGKGIKYVDERIIRKSGKSGKE